MKVLFIRSCLHNEYKQFHFISKSFHLAAKLNTKKRQFLRNESEDTIILEETIFEWICLKMDNVARKTQKASIWDGIYIFNIMIRSIKAVLCLLSVLGQCESFLEPSFRQFFHRHVRPIQ